MVVWEAMHGEFEIVRNSFEEETKHAIGESGWLFGIWNNAMNDMHLQVEKFTVNRVLWWCVEMVLEALHLCALAVLVKQANGLGDEVVVIWILVFQNKLVLRAFLVVL